MYTPQILQSMTSSQSNILIDIIKILPLAFALKYHLYIDSLSALDLYKMIVDALYNGLNSTTEIPVENFYDSAEEFVSTAEEYSRMKGVSLLVGTIVLICILTFKASAGNDIILI